MVVPRGDDDWFIAMAFRQYFQFAQISHDSPVIVLVRSALQSFFFSLYSSLISSTNIQLGLLALKCHSEVFRD